MPNQKFRFYNGCGYEGGVRCKVEHGRCRNYIEFPVRDNDQGEYYIATYDERTGAITYTPEEKRTHSKLASKEDILKAQLMIAMRRKK